ncbi:MAG: peptidase M10 [Chitinophagaceae bacterium]
MGEAEINKERKALVIHSHIITYGNAADEPLSEQIRDEIETMWNEPHATGYINGTSYLVQFRITAELRKDITDLEVYQNVTARNNYFRIEEYAHGNISFVDGLGCNSGYFKLENLYQGSTTAAHEYGHTLGLDHPNDLDLRGKGVPGIMYPRGTLVDPQFQYDPMKPAGVTGSTMHPMHRRVKQTDIDLLRLHRLPFKNERSIIGQFTNIYHWNHTDIGYEDFVKPPIFG